LPQRPQVLQRRRPLHRRLLQPGKRDEFVDSEDFRCVDDDLCTIDTCVPSTGECRHDPCNDLDPCTIDSCDPKVGCATVSVCDDGNLCTSDQCDRASCREKLIDSCEPGNTACTDVCDYAACQAAGNTEDYCRNNCIREIRNQCADRCDKCAIGPCDASCGDLCDWLTNESPMDICDPVKSPSSQRLKQCGKELCDDLELCTDEQVAECRDRCRRITCAFKCLEDTADLCDADAFCSNKAKDDGASCGDAFDFTDDVCVQGECITTITTAPEVFRVGKMTLEQPKVMFDLGNGPVEVNDLIGAFLTDYLDKYQYGGLVAAFDAIDFAFTGASVDFGEGACTFFTGGGAESCALLPWGGQAGFDKITYAATGTCTTDPAVPAPCFVTGEGSFDLNAIVPDIVPAGLGNVVGFAVGRFDGDPTTGIKSGYIEGVVPTALIDALSDKYPINLGTDVASLKDLLKDVATEDMDGGGKGYRVRLGYTASKVDALSLPQGCNKDPSQCADGAKCNPFTGDCS